MQFPGLFGGGEGTLASIVSNGADYVLNSLG